MKKSYFKNVVNESYVRPSRPTVANFNPKEWLFVDLGMGMNTVEYIDDVEDVKEMLESGALKKLSSPAGVNIWKSSEGSLLIHVKRA